MGDQDGGGGGCMGKGGTRPEVSIGQIASN